MDPNLGLLAASGLVSFLLKTIAEWMVCLLLVRIAGSARLRFNLWLMMLLGFVAQWVWMWVGFAHVAFPAATVFRAEALAGNGAGGRVVGEGARVAVAAASVGNLAQAMVVLLICYGLMLAWRTMGTVAAWISLTRAMRHKIAPQERVANFFQEALEQTGSDGNRLRDCELWVLPGLASPATVGWRQPRVIVPPVCEIQDAAELQAVFWHELKHVERRDALWNAVVRVCRNLLWFHPCVHHAIAALNGEREFACDAAVVREHPQSRDVYATCLVRFARMRDLATETTATGIEMASGAALLNTRVRSILSETQNVSRISRGLRVAGSMILVGVMAASVPALNILFAAEASASAMGMQLPIVIDIPAAGQRRSLKSAGMRTLAAGPLAASGSVDLSASAAVALRHDENLAAEHRAAMDILTEATGMDAPTIGNEGRVSQGVNGPAPAHGSAGQAAPSWAAVAVDAAERMGPLMNDHDSDDHH